MKKQNWQQNNANIGKLPPEKGGLIILCGNSHEGTKAIDDGTTRKESPYFR